MDLCAVIAHLLDLVLFCLLSYAASRSPLRTVFGLICCAIVAVVFVVLAKQRSSRHARSTATISTSAPTRPRVNISNTRRSSMPSILKRLELPPRTVLYDYLGLVADTKTTPRTARAKSDPDVILRRRPSRAAFSSC
ncbi:hypothetical protein PUNSTDRAFT_54860 [Punctularia strigosozonata HHB-11173 SS5]|uniref:uncharacterized protein n=1 Tax=Punctularia strigosozonata (strain HHB-11173) TaxID=741275 RepID=UPI0004416903|nr:uncharacterized protein PUNSTDRAFT_54860 [Punctularia strigosozonata HHB-11173 SS5]EIN05469.1 hypothetical protein PUNSTDRAFT_54860 [Punctularia strigosozonata HHB-11173 SS5]